MTVRFSLESDTFTIHDYNRARPFSSFLPGIAGERGKPMWVFYANRGQCISSFGVRNRNGAMLEFYPANKAYIATPLLGFRTFLRIGKQPKAIFYEPFKSAADAPVEQVMRIRAHEVEIEETHRGLGLRTKAVFFNVPNEDRPILLRQLEIENLTGRSLPITLADGLPQIVPYGLAENLLKAMSRTMEAFTEVTHGESSVPFFKLKVEPSDKPEVKWIEAGFFSFSLLGKKLQPILTDPEAIFGNDTSFENPGLFKEGRSLTWKQRFVSITPSSFTRAQFVLPARSSQTLHSYFGQADRWAQADAFRRRAQGMGRPFAEAKRKECAQLLRTLTDTFAVHSGVEVLDPYTRQAYLDNSLRGGLPYVVPRADAPQVFHYYSRKHGDMERDYNFFEVAPTYFSQGNGNFRDVNQNRRSEALQHPGVGAANIETFFNLLQLDGYNPLVIQFEKFYLTQENIAKVETRAPEKRRAAWRRFLTTPFSPGELYAYLLEMGVAPAKAQPLMNAVLGRAEKIQDASHGEGYWIDHWTYNLDLIENFAAVYPDQLKALFVDRRDFSYFDNDHVVQPRNKKYVRRPDGAIRQMGAVVVDGEKRALLSGREEDPYKVRTRLGQGTIYRSSLMAKVIGLLAVKGSTLDPFGMGIEMEAEKPGWCDALNGLPGLLGSSVNESFELRRWITFVEDHMPAMLEPGESVAFAEEMAEFIGSVREALAIAKNDDFFKTWDTLSSLRERFREKTRLGVTGVEAALTREEIESFITALKNVLDAGLGKTFQRSGLCATYYINEAVEFDVLPAPEIHPGEEASLPNVKIKRFRQIPVSPFLEGPVHALRVLTEPAKIKKLYRAVKASELFDRKLKMYRLNVPLTRESYEIGRNKIFAPGWLENESVFLHMAYKFLLETLRSGLSEEFFADLRGGLVAFQKPSVYGRSTYENSSFIVSSRFPDARLHGAGFVARLTGATAEWISIVLHMGLGRQPFHWEDGQISFAPTPTLPAWIFSKTAKGGFERDTFGFKLFGKTWIVYRNLLRVNTFGPSPLQPSSYRLRYADGRESTHAGAILPDAPARDLRDGKLTHLFIDLDK